MEERARVFAEDAIRALGRGDVPTARMTVAQAYEHDHKLGALADAVNLACAEIDADGKVSDATWNVLGDAVGPGPLLAVVEDCRAVSAR